MVLSSGDIIHGASLRDQCYENYFYGADGGIEHGFSEMEAAFSAAVGDLSHERLDALSDEDCHVIRIFAHYQKFRTVGAADETTEFMGGLTKRTLAKDPQLGPEKMAKARIEFKDPQYDTLFGAAESEPIVFDLAVKFLISDKRAAFVLSDEPLISINQWLEHHPILHETHGDGIALRGLQWFLPLSAKVCVAVYDPAVYEYGSCRRRTCGIGVRDIQLLNELQVHRARECLYFDRRYTSEDDVHRLRWARSRRKSVSYGTEFHEGELEKLPDGTRRVFIGATVPFLRPGVQLTCVRVKDRDAVPIAPDGTIAPPVRSPQLIHLMEEYSRFLREKREENLKAWAAVKASGERQGQPDTGQDEDAALTKRKGQE